MDRFDRKPIYAASALHWVRTQQHRWPVGGFTLIEALVVLVVVGILLASAIPGFGRLLSSHRASTATNDFVHGIALARSEALRRNRRVYLAPVDGHWHNGWVVFIDHNDNRVYDEGAGQDELIASHASLPDSVAISNPSSAIREPFTDVGTPRRPYVMFDGSGYPRQRNGGFNIGSLAVTDRTGGHVTVRTICLASYGRVRIVNDNVGCS